MVVRADEELAQDWSAARRTTTPCCGPLVMKYEPGVSLIYCAECERKVAVPDWDPNGLVEKWENEKPIQS